jgi:uncharacterized membrane protein
MPDTLEQGDPQPRFGGRIAWVVGDGEDSGPATVRRTVGPVGDPQTAGWWERLWGPFWVLPSMICLLAVGAGLLLPQLDAHLADDLPYLFGGNADSARSLLSTIASAMISVTGLVFSITMVVLQLASSQFSPRLLGSFLGNRITQVTLGVFTSSFVFALIVLRDVRGGDEPFVPQLSVTVAFLLVLASVALFFAFIHHITVWIQVSQVIDRISAQTVGALEKGTDDAWIDTSAVPPAWSQAAGPSVVVSTGSGHGVVQRVQYTDLVRAAERADAVVELRTRTGEVRHRGQELAVVHGVPAGDQVVREVRAAVGLGRERSMQQDPEFGVRQLVDIAERALSPGINDPTTAVQVLDELHRVLRVAGARADPSAHLVDASGTVRVIDVPTTFARLLDLSLDEIAHYGKNSLQVPRRIDALLDDLEGWVRQEHAAVVVAKRAALEARHGGQHADEGAGP